MWSVLLSVDYFGRGGYIISRALMLFSPFFVSWHVLVMRAVLWSSAPIALVIAPIKRFLRGTTGAIFFTDFHFISSHLSAACYGFAFCYSTTNISISPRSSPRYPRHGGRGGAWLRYE